MYTIQHCTVTECKTICHYKNYCAKHYMRLKRTGHTELPTNTNYHKNGQPRPYQSNLWLLPEYATWSEMRGRILRPSHTHYLWR